MLLSLEGKGGFGGSSGAPLDAAYIVQTPSGVLTGEQALSVLGTGLLKNTTGTGILSIATPEVDYATASQGSLADTALQPADIGTLIQGWDSDLDVLAGLAKTDGNFIVGNGANWVVESGAVARASLGLGSAALSNVGDFATAAQGVTADSAVQPGDLAAVALSGDYGDLLNSPSLATVATTGAYADLSGTPTLGTLAALNSPLPIANGGSGQTSQQEAIDALTAVSAATNEHVLTKDTGTGNAVWKAAAGGSSLPVADTQTIVMGSADNTKLLRFEVDGFTAGATRVLTPPNADATIAGLEVANVFTALQTVNLADSQALDVAGYASVQRLYLKGDGSAVGPNNVFFTERPSSSNRRLMIYGPAQSNQFGYVVSPTDTSLKDTFSLLWSADIDGGASNVPFGGFSVLGNSGSGDVDIFSDSTGATAGAIRISPDATQIAKFTTTGLMVGHTINPTARLDVRQISATAALPTLRLLQSDLSEEFIRFASTVGAGNPIDTAALGAYYGKIRVYVEGVGAKWLALYD